MGVLVVVIIIHIEVKVFTNLTMRLICITNHFSGKKKFKKFLERKIVK